MERPVLSQKKFVDFPVDKAKKKVNFYSSRLLLLTVVISITFNIVFLLKSVPTFSLQEETLQNPSTLDKLKKILLLPSEPSTIGEIRDIDTLKNGNPQFYQNAINGDKLILFKEIAVIYREELNLIVNMAAIDTSGE